MSVVHSGVYSTDTQYDPTVCEYVEAGRGDTLPAVVVEVWDQNSIPCGPMDSVLSDHTSRIESDPRPDLRGNVATLFLETCKRWLEKEEDI